MFLTWDRIPEVFLEPADQRADRGKHLHAIPEAVWSEGDVLVAGDIAGHVGQQELAWVLFTGTDQVRYSKGEKNK